MSSAGASLVRRLRDKTSGRVIGPDDPDYFQARAVHNAMIDKRPLAVVRCSGVADVAAVVRLTSAAGVPLAIRGGGHSGPGFGTVDDGVVLDLSAMSAVTVDPANRAVRVEGGATVADLDAATAPFGLAAPAGIISTTGVGGLTLGGGHGYLTRRYGLTIDNLRAAEVVLADGSVVRADEASHPDLLWALRGGGGNFGVVTAMELALHDVTPFVAGPMLWTLDRTAEVLAWYREFIPAAPEDLYGFFALLTVPPADPFPRDLHGKKACGVIWAHVGDPERAQELLTDARRLQPDFDGVGPVTYQVMQQAFDALYPAGLQAYWRGAFLTEIPDDAIAVHAEHGGLMPTPLSTMHLYPVDGAAHRVGADETAWSFREARWSAVIVGVDPDPASAGTLRNWCVDYSDALRPFTAGAGYVNFLMESDDGQERMRAAYRGNFPRLVEVKRRYDPDNVFRVNHNIVP